MADGSTAVVIIDVQEAMFSYPGMNNANLSGEIVQHHNSVLGGRFAKLRKEHEVEF